MALKEGFYKFGYYGDDHKSVSDDGLVLVHGGKLTIVEDPNNYLKHLMKGGEVPLDFAENVMKSINRNHYGKFSYSDDEELYDKYKDLIPETHEFFKSEVPATGANMGVRQVAEGYMGSKGQNLVHPPKVKVNEGRAQKIAQAYHEMKHDPEHPQVKRAYDALKQETMAQFKHMMGAGLKVSRIKPGQENPYKTSKDLLHDVRENNHMWFFPTEQGFGSSLKSANSHPLLESTGIEHEGKPLLYNDVFRIVHDYFGHVKEGHGFGPQGEENAWHNHMQMYSPEAQRALTSETRGQNSWVNFGPHAQHNRTNPSQTIYADQKAGLLPDWAMEHSSEDVAKAESYEEWDTDYFLTVDLEKSDETEEDLSQHHGKDVFVYFNLHKKVWSIKDRKTGLVIAHSKKVAVDSPRFKVSEAGRQRVLRDKAKNVHAGVVGKLNAHHSDFSSEGKKRVSYNPYKYEHFYESDTQAPVHSADHVTLHVEDKQAPDGKLARVPHVYAKNPTSNSPAVAAEVNKSAEKIPGGMSSGKKPEDFDQEQLADGIKVEMEHTTDKQIAQEIAMDHLTEDADYYKKLKAMEAKKSQEADLGEQSLEKSNGWASLSEGAGYGKFDSGRLHLIKVKKEKTDEYSVSHHSFDAENYGDVRQHRNEKYPTRELALKRAKQLTKDPSSEPEGTAGLEKGWKEVAAGIAMAGAVAGTASAEISPTSHITPPAPKKAVSYSLGKAPSYRDLKPGEKLESYKDPKHLATEKHYERAYHLPKGLITSIRLAGERSNWSQSSNLGTKSPYQFTETSRNLYNNKYKVDAHKDTDSAIHATAIHLRESLKFVESKFKGKTEDEKAVLAAKHFHGGPNTKEWGSVNQAYGDRIARGMSAIRKNPNLKDLDSVFDEKRSIASASKKPQSEKDKVAKAKKITEIAKSLVLEKIGQITHSMQPQSVGHDVFQKDLEAAMGSFSVDSGGVRSFNDKKKEDDRINSLNQVPAKHKEKFERAMRDADLEGQIIGKLTSLKKKLKR